MHAPLTFRATAAALAPLLAALSCAPTFAPPARSISYGAPGRLRPTERFEVGGVVTGPPAPLTGDPYAGVRLTERIALELGATLSLLDDDEDTRFGLGWVGVRATLYDGRGGGDSGFVLDGEAGTGLGAGGMRHVRAGGDGEEEEEDGIAPLDRLAGGVYVGSGQGWQFARWCTVFLNERLQLTGAENVPATFWWSVGLGVEFTGGPVSFWISGGGAGYANSVDTEVGPLGMGGISLHL